MRTLKTTLLRWLNRLMPAWALIASFILLSLTLLILLWIKGAQLTSELASIAGDPTGAISISLRNALIVLETSCALLLVLFACAIALLAWHDHRRK